MEYTFADYDKYTRSYINDSEGCITNFEAMGFEVGCTYEEHFYPGKQPLKVLGTAAELSQHPEIHTIIKAMVSAWVAAQEDTYLFSEVSIGATHWSICQIV